MYVPTKHFTTKRGKWKRFPLIFSGFMETSMVVEYSMQADRPTEH